MQPRPPSAGTDFAVHTGTKAVRSKTPHCPRRAAPTAARELTLSPGHCRRALQGGHKGARKPCRVGKEVRGWVGVGGFVRGDTGGWRIEAREWRRRGGV